MGLWSTSVDAWALAGRELGGTVSVLAGRREGRSGADADMRFEEWRMSCEEGVRCGDDEESTIEGCGKGNGGLGEERVKV